MSRRRNPIWLKFLIITAIVLLIIFIFIHNTLLPIFFSLAEAKAINIANKAINEAVNNYVEDIKYGDLIDYETDNQGNIVLMQPNIKVINRVSSNIALNIQDKLENISKVDVAVPLLKLLGLDILAGLGPNLHAKIIPVGFVRPPKIEDSFQSAGINQTRHKIYLHVGARLKLIVPFSSRIISVKSDVPVIEVTIVGKVPQVYVGLNGDKLSGIINDKKQKTQLKNENKN